MNLDDAPDDLLARGAFVRGLARALVADANAADDVAQSAWLAALEARPGTVRSWPAWLAGAARFLASRERRDAARRAARERAAARLDRVPSAAELFERENARRRLVRAVFELPDPYRTAVALRYVEDVPPVEIARRLGVNESTVRTRIHRGLEQLRRELDAEFGGRGAWCAVLAPIALGPAGAMAPATAASSAGLSSGAKLALAFGAGVALTLGIWLAESSGAARVPEDRATLARADATGGADAAGVPVSAAALDQERRDPSSAPAPSAAPRAVEPAAALTAVPAAPPSKIAIRIRALNPFGGAMSSVEINVSPSVQEGGYDMKGAATVVASTSTDGVASFPDWPQGVPCVVKAWGGTAYAFTPRTVYPPVGASECIVTMTAAGCGELRGRLVDAAKQQPLAGEVTLEAVAAWRNTPPVKVSAESDGMFRATRVPDGQWTLRASSPGTETLTTEVSVDASSTNDLGSLMLRPAPVVSGVVTAPLGMNWRVFEGRVAVGNVPREGATSKRPPTRSIRGGAASEDTLGPSGSFWLGFPDDQREYPVYGSLVFPTRNALPCLLGYFRAPNHNVRITWPIPAQISVRVRDLAHLSEPPSADVRGIWVGREERGSLDVEFTSTSRDTFAGYAIPGTLLLLVRPKGDVMKATFGRTLQSIEIADGARNYDSIVDVEPVHRVRLHVMDDSGRPIARLPIRVRWSPPRDVALLPVSTVYSDFEGAAEIAAVGRRVRVAIDVEGLEAVDKSFELGLDEETDVGSVVVRRLD